MPSNKPTIKTIAQMAGVSHVAVSLALRGEGGVSQAKAQQIRKIACELGYTPNAAARNLLLGRSSGIGVVLPAMGEYTAFHTVYNVVSQQAARHGYIVSLGCTGHSLELEEKYCRLMAESGVGAIIVAPISRELAHIQKACPLIPVILLGGCAAGDTPYAALFDYAHSAALVTEHLCGLGHREIAFLNHGANHFEAGQKALCFRAEMEKRNLAGRVFTPEAEDALTAGKMLAEHLLEEKKMPTALWCASDMLAMGVLHTLAKHGLSAPRDLSLVGHDNLFFDCFPGVELTSLRMPREEAAGHVISLALSLMGEKVEAPPPQKVFAPSLIVRSSSGPPRRQAEMLG